MNFGQYEYIALNHLRVSPDNKLVAYLLDTKGDEEYTLFIKDLSTGATLRGMLRLSLLWLLLLMDGCRHCAGCARRRVGR